MSEIQLSDWVTLLFIGFPAVLIAVLMMAVSRKTDDPALGLQATQIVVLCLIVLALVGCADWTPYVAARHVDATPLEGGNDAWDVGCTGIKYRNRLTAKTGYCWNVRGGNMFEASIEYDLFGRAQ